MAMDHLREEIKAVQGVIGLTADKAASLETHCSYKRQEMSELESYISKAGSAETKEKIVGGWLREEHKHLLASYGIDPEKASHAVLYDALRQEAEQIAPQQHRAQDLGAEMDQSM
ncbi:MAG: hypothetical protein ACK5LX_04735 [Oscillospiraceae bacterium]